MSGFVRLLPVEKVPPGRMVAVPTEQREYLVARVDEQFYVAENKCPHMGADLHAGTLTGTVVTCPRHGSRFDLRDGRVLQWTGLKGVALGASKLLRPPQPLRTFAVKVEEGYVLVGPENPPVTS